MTINSVSVRNFSLQDINRVVEIEQASFAIDAFSSASFKRYYRECPDLFLIAELSGVIVGNMITCILGEKGIITSIAVDPAYRRKGVGKTLVTHTFNHLKSIGIHDLELKVRIMNRAGICFWKSLGFVSHGIITNYYIDGADALQMTKKNEIMI